VTDIPTATRTALGVIVFYAVYQQVESAFLTPTIMRNEVKLSPVAVISALLLGAVRRQASPVRLSPYPQLHSVPH
jgi:hypothetical protein